MYHCAPNSFFLLSLDLSYHMGQVGECKNKLSHMITYPLITSYMLWFNQMLHFLKTLVNGEISFLSNSNFDGQVEVIDIMNLIFSLPIKETFNYSFTVVTPRVFLRVFLKKYKLYNLI